MASIHPHTFAEETTSRRRNTKPRSTHTSKRNVYGKRRTDAPRAVLEERSPAKPQTMTDPDTIQQSVDCIQAKLADIQLDETKTAEYMEEEHKKDDTNIETSAPIHIVDEIPKPTPTSLTEPAPVQQPSTKVTPVAKKRFQEMVAVRITPRAIPQGSQEQAKKVANNTPAALDSCKRSARKTKPTRRTSSGYVSNEKATSYVRSILDQTLSPVAALGIQKFDSWAARAGEMLEVVKLAEGSYGEVYKLRLREDICQKEMSKSKLARLKACGDGVFKVVPLRAQSGPGSKKFTSIEEIVAEVKMLKYLDPIPGFARFREIHVVQGRFPEAFQKAWDRYKKTKNDCLNPNPSSKRAYPDSQIWAIIEMDDAGCELEKFSWASIFQVYDIFWGVAMSLARAEEYALFEVTSLCLSCGYKYELYLTSI